MSRRSVASLLALGLLVVLVAALAVQRVPWVVYSPGPTVNVLDEFQGKPIIEVEGHPAYRDKGGLRLLTVVSTGPKDKVNLLAAMTAWFDPDRAVYPYDAIYQPKDTNKSVRQQSAAQMTSSQDNAVAAALEALHLGFGRAVRVSRVEQGGASAGVLKAGDLLVAVDGRPTRTPEALVKAIAPRKPGTVVHVSARRAGKLQTFTLTTKPAPDDPKKSLIGVNIEPTFDFPFQVDLNISDNIGGPSAGMMFAVGIYDVLTKGSLTRGKVIAGTGEIDPDGNVGPIGGIAQKLVAAQRDGAHLFLAPQANCDEALDAHFDRSKMRLVRVDTVEQAIADVKAWAADPNAELPRCTR